MNRASWELDPRLGGPDTARHEDRGTVVDVPRIARGMWEGRWIIAAITAVTVALSLLATMNSEPTYTATAKVMFDPQLREIAAGGEGAAPGVDETLIQNEIQILRSTPLLYEVIDRHDLAELAEFDPDPGPVATLVRGLLPGTADGDEAGPGSSDLHRRIAVRNVVERLEIAPVPSSHVIDINFTSTDRDLAALVANAFARQYIEGRSETLLSTTQAATDWLAGRVEDLSRRLNEAERAVALARARQSEGTGQSATVTRQRLDALIDSYAEIEGAARSARVDYERLRTVVADGVDLGTVPEFRASGILGDLEARRANLQVEYAELLEDLPPDHPSVVALRGSLERTDSMLEEEAGRIVKTAHATWKALLEQESATEAEIRLLDRELHEKAEEELTIRQLEREADASRALYERFLGRLNAALEQVRLDNLDVRILSLAEPPISASSQPRIYAIAVALVAGVLIGAGYLYLRDRFRTTFRSPDEIREIAGVDVIGTTPASCDPRDPGAAFRQVVEEPRSPLAEAIHGVRLGLLLNQRRRPPRVVLFTSSVAGEGSSLIAALTAASEARAGRRAILVDCDLRDPRVGRILGESPDDRDVAAVASGRIPLAGALRREPTTGLHALVSDAPRPGPDGAPMEVLSSAGFSGLIDELRDAYDLVILSGPPTSLAAETRLLGQQADTVVYVVRWRRTAIDAVLAGLRSLDTAGAVVGGVVLSMVGKSKAAGREAGPRAPDAGGIEGRRGQEA